jgi:ribonuclease HI/uncharacterized phage-like protein YoqJ
VYTDGACSGNPGPGGWAWAVPGGRFRSGREAHSTNQRMEIAAALDALRSLDGTLEVVSDSTYVVNCFRDRWWEGWMARGWKTSAKKDVANQDLWRPFIEAYRADPDRVRFRWVKGHSGDVMNDLVDRLAVEAATTQQPREGDRPPTQLGPADRPRAGAPMPGGSTPGGNQPGAATPSANRITPATPASASPAMSPPPGHLLVVAGLRPPELGGYGDNPVADKVRTRLGEILAAQASLHPDLVVASGMGLGAEQLGAEAAISAGVPLAAVLAFPGVEEVWPGPSRQRFADLVSAATYVITLQTARPISKAQAGAALARRDAWLARHAGEALVVWDNSDATVGRSLRSLQDHLGEDQVWILEPQ